MELTNVEVNSRSLDEAAVARSAATGDIRVSRGARCRCADLGSKHVFGTSGPDRLDRADGLTALAWRRPPFSPT